MRVGDITNSSRTKRNINGGTYYSTVFYDYAFIAPLPRIYQYPCPIETRLPVSPARPGSFNANFAPVTLEAYKNLCRQQGKQYTKVLEQLAEIYLKTNGKVLEEISVPSPAITSVAVPASSSINTRGGTVAELLERIGRVEADDREFVNAFKMLVHRVEALESKVESNEEQPKYHPRKY